MDKFMMKTLEEERLLREHVQRHLSSIVPSTWEERMLRMQIAEARNKESYPHRSSSPIILRSASHYVRPCVVVERSHVSNESA